MNGRVRVTKQLLLWASLALLLSSVASAEDPAEMAELARKYQNGIACPRDIGKALYWYKRAADADDPTAMVALGDLYDAGICVPEDLPLAVKYYRRAADIGFAPAMMRMATMTERARGVKFIPSDVVEWYKRAAAIGYGPAMTRLADLDDHHAEEWLRKGVAAKDPAAFGKLARLTKSADERNELHRRGAELGDGASFAALGRYREAAEAGDPAGMSRYAKSLEPDDLGQAAVWYRKAALAGDLAGMVRYGELQESGQITKQDLAAARLLYKAAADSGYGPGMTHLAALVENENPGQALSFYRSGAEAGDPAAMVRMAALVPAESDAWLRRAAVLNEPNALAALGMTEAAAKAGHVPSMRKLGMWDAAARAGDPEAMRRFSATVNDPGEAARWILKAAKADDPVAMTWAGNRYHSGLGLEKNPAEAERWWKSAAGKGEPEALFHLGEIEKSAAAGYPPAMVRWAETSGDKTWLERAAATGYANAYTKLGQLERGAEAGDPEAKLLLARKARKPQDGYRLITEAAAAGYAPAMVAAADCLLTGRGTYRSEVDALLWLRRAADAGDPSAATRVRQLEQRLH